MQSPIQSVEPVVVMKAGKRKAPKKGKVSTVPPTEIILPVTYVSLLDFAKERHLEIQSKQDKFVPEVCLETPMDVDETATLLAKIADVHGIEAVLGPYPEDSNIVEIPLEPEYDAEIQITGKCLVNDKHACNTLVKITCSCGAMITQKSLGKHVKTAKHLKVVPVFDGI
jgi:hypothetical protein